MVGKGPRTKEIKKIEDIRRRRVAFSKRRKELFQKAEELGQNFDAEVAIVTVSSTGKVFSFGTPSVDSVVNRYLLAHGDNAQNPEQDPSPADQTNSGPGGKNMSDDEMRLALSMSLTSAEEKVDDSPVKEMVSEMEKQEQGNRVENLQMQETHQLKEEMDEMKKVVENRADPLEQ